MIPGLIITVIAVLLVELVFGKRRDKEIEASLPKGNFLIVDTETIGKVHEVDFMMSNHLGFPKIQQICWILIDPKGNEINRKNYLINGASRNAKTKAPKAIKTSLEIALEDLKNDLSNAHYLVAHNVEYDKNVLKGEAERNEFSIGIGDVQTICTMKLATKYCKIRNNGKYKWPKLTELYECLFKEQIEEKHEAEYDTEICLKCFKQMYNQRVIKMKDVHNIDYNI